jgi:AraC-like DNA-binding protein
MVSIRCKMIMKAALDELGLPYSSIELGEVILKNDISLAAHEMLKNALAVYGLVLLDDRKTSMIEKIKGVIIEMVHYADELTKMKKSDYISNKLNHDYTYLSNLFSEATGTTIEKFIILHKIERAKELLVYDELSLTEISYKLNYSSVAHLSNQFKKITGLSPAYFKKIGGQRLPGLKNV